MEAIELWNALAARWWDWLAQAAAGSLVAGALAGLLWLAVRRRASAHLGHLLFALTLVPLLLPALPVLRMRVGEDAPGAALVAALPSARGHAPPSAAPSPTPPPISTAETPPAPASSVAPPADELHAAAEMPSVRPSPTAWLALGWALVVAALAARFLAVQLATQRMVRRATALSESDAARVDTRLTELRARSGVHRPVRIAESAAVAAPAVWGIRTPTIVLPPRLLARLDDEQLDWVLLHELAHVARGDLCIAALQRVAQILWFFHPLVWLTNRAVEELRECACDEAALARTAGARPRRCAEALLEVVAGRIPSPTPRLALQTLHDETAVMKKRMLRLIDPRRSARSRLSPAALPVVAPVLAVVAGSSLASVELAPAAPAQKPVVQRPDDDEADPYKVNPYEPKVDPAAQVEQARDAVRRGLGWLVANQRPDGSWPQGPTTDVEAGEFTDVGVTGLCILALLDAEREPSHAELMTGLANDVRRGAIVRALDYLGSVQDAEGRFGGAKSIRALPSHAVATRAWIAGGGVRPDEQWKERAQRAVDALLGARNPYGGWRYEFVPIGDNDSVMTSLVLLTLVAAREASLDVSADAMRGGFSILDEFTDPESGRTGYDRRGSRPSRLAGKKETFPAEHTEMCTSLAMLARMATGVDPIESKEIRMGAQLITESAPIWDPYKGSIDYYHWAFGTQALQPLGGYQFEHWRRRLHTALLPNQQEDGWWPAIDAWSEPGTVCHSTVMAVMALQASVR